MKIKTNCTKCGKTMEMHSDKWLSKKYTNEELIELKIEIINREMQLKKEKNNECFECYFGIK